MSRPNHDDRHRLMFRAVLGCAVVWLAGTASVKAQSPAPPPEAPSIPFDASYHPEGAGSSGSYTLKETILQSIFPSKDDPRQWTPLTIGNLFEGWLEPFINPPDTTGGSVRQGWIGVTDAFFNRQIVGLYNYTHAKAGGRNENDFAMLFESPISRRWDVGILAPSISSQESNGIAPSMTDFADVTIQNRFMLEDTKDFILSFNFNIELPTGDAAAGYHRTILNPYLAWMVDVGNGFSFRGGSGFAVPVDNKPDGVDSVYFLDVGVGQTLTKHDAAPLGDFTYYLCAEFRQEFGGGDHTFLSITPGFRTHLGNNWFLLGGVAIPVNGPRAYEDQLTILFLKGF